MELSDLCTLVASLKDRVALCSTNHEQRQAYSDCELLILRLEKILTVQPDDEKCIMLRDELAVMSTGMRLSYIYRPQSLLMKIVNKLDELVRLLAVWIMLTICSIFVAIPCILLTPIDYLLVKCGIISVYWQISVVCKLFLSRMILRASGIQLEIQGMKTEHFGKECVLACFSHASSMDAFLITAAIPVTALTVVSSWKVVLIV